ncbi:MAG TPA: hypothetical protein VLM85_15425 [Polyangiaceae bacterium]|nr:hypothetical protein [Polyangiaceae bacterium]
MQRLFALALLLLASLALSGCTLIGLGIGAAVPKYTPVDSASAGTRVRVTTDEGATVEGTVEKNEASGLVVRGEGQTYQLPLDRIRQLEERTSHLRTGAAVGGAIDGMCLVAAFVLFAVAVENFSSSMRGWSGMSFQGGM